MDLASLIAIWRFEKKDEKTLYMECHPGLDLESTLILVQFSSAYIDLFEVTKTTFILWFKDIKSNLKTIQC